MTSASPSPSLPVEDSSAASVPERSPGYWQGVLKRLLRDRLAVAAGLVVLLLILMAVFAPLLTPADPFAASMLKRLQPVGSEISELRIPAPKAPESAMASSTEGKA